MTDHFWERLSNCVQLYCQERAASKTVDSFVNYGTAGFRGNATEIERLFYKVGLISALRCLKLGSNIGVMVTASHNPVQDNGIKLIDANGEMLSSEWETIVERFCNLRDDKDELLYQLNNIIQEQQIDILTASDYQVFIGSDTRPSSKALVDLVKKGLEPFTSLVQHRDFGQLTTPALHYMVAESNEKKLQAISLTHYYDELLIDGLIDIFSKETDKSMKFYLANELVVDCANGIGYETMKILMGNQTFHKHLPFELINIGDGVLNYLCGADHVKTIQKPPIGANQIRKRYASLDGDADRLVYFYLDNDPAIAKGDESELKLHLLDGDKIMALYALYLSDILEECRLKDKLTFAVVQTAYANGASTDYLANVLGLQVEFADTGVKNLHKRVTNYDIGIYFEANGHGTIWLSAKAKALIADIYDNNDALIRFRQLIAILNNYTGDAISDMLIVETILRHYDWDVKKWYQMYEDRPNKLTKVEVKDRNCIKTTNAGMTCVEPLNLQAEIDKIISHYGHGARSFVRASGTENVVRIYVEAQSQEAANELADRVGIKVKELCNI